MNASSLKGMPVVSMADGMKVGNVVNIMFATQDLHVTALLLRGQAGQSTLPFASIRSIGSDAVTVESAAVTQGVTGQSGLDSSRGLDELTSLTVVDAAGTVLGTIREIEIDDAGRLAELIVQRGGIFGLGGTSTTVPVAAIRSIGPKLITVELPDTPEPAPQ